VVVLGAQIAELKLRQRGEDGFHVHVVALSGPTCTLGKGTRGGKVWNATG
jgi:hypothetical protein